MPRLSLAGMLFEIEPFEPLPEFVAGPLNAGSFGPNPLDGTFGPEVVFQKAAPTPNSSPGGGLPVLRRGGD
jgi:phosphodiesterase/alkaline phosphatase D-like protein